MALSIWMWGVSIRTWTDAGGPSREAVGASHVTDDKDPYRPQEPAGHFQFPYAAGNVSC